MQTCNMIRIKVSKKQMGESRDWMSVSKWVNVKYSDEDLEFGSAYMLY